MSTPHTTPSAAPYRLTHGSPLTDAQAAHLLTRAATGEPLTHAPVKRGPAWVLAHLTTLTAQERTAHAQRVAMTAQLLDGRPVPASLTA